MNLYRFYCSDWSNRPYEAGSAATPEDLVIGWLRENEWVWDADNCGEDNYDWLVKNIETGEITYVRTEHSWYITYDPEWTMHNDFFYEIITKEDLKEPILGDHDWMFVSKDHNDREGTPWWKKPKYAGKITPPPQP